ncbi:MAG: Prokaryotic lipoprotein-attachment site [Moraxellaceae bacterium]|jgi:predicted small lipoprotein YifL|nr:Prokaryotic lipoprotein-attachment site [Moraxellaceae bacterium]
MPNRLLLLFMLLLGGCGQKGPLYLPAKPSPAPAPEVAPATTPDAPAETAPAPETQSPPLSPAAKPE